MFKVAAKWRSEKNKTKAVFRFEFHATQMTKLGWEVPMVSLVPLDVGKATAKSEKAVVLEGCCHWRKPIFETVKFIHDPETGKNNDKLYNFIVSAIGSANIATIGEATINLSDYATILKPCTVVLLLRASDSGPILHVNIQRVQADAGKREPDEIQEQRRIAGKLNRHSNEENSKVFSIHVHPREDCTMTKSQMIFPYHGTMLLQEKFRHSLKISALSTNDNSGQCTLKENGSMLKNYVRVLSTFSKNGPDGIMDRSANTSDDEKLDERSLDSDLWKLEFLTHRKQVVKENRHGQELSRELSIIKERDALRKECEELKDSKKRCGYGTASKKSHFHGEIQQSTLDEIKQELNHEKSLNVNLCLQLQKTQESNTELMLAVQDLDELLEQKNRESAYINSPTIPIELSNSKDSSEVKQEQEPTETMYDEDSKKYALVRAHDDVRVEQIMDLNNEIEMCKRDREELEMQIEQIALDYEILKQENHNISTKLEQYQLREQLRMQYECSAHLAIIRDLENHVGNLKNELEEKTETYEADVQSVMHAKIWQEQRTIQAEEELRKSRWSNAKTAEQLEEGLERLSAQISSTFHMNGKLTMEAITEVSELRTQKCHLEKTNEELSFVHDNCEVRIQELSRIIESKTKEIDRLLTEHKDTSENLERQKREEAAREKASEEEMLILKAELEKLSRENIHIPEHIEKEKKLIAEMQQLKESTKELGQTIQNMTLEIDLLGRELASLRHLKDEKDMVAIRNLNLEVTALRVQHREMNHSFEDEVEKENPRKEVEVIHQRGNLRKKGDVPGTEKRLKVSNGITKATTVRNKNNNINGRASQESKEVVTLRETNQLLEGELKIKNKTMEEMTSSFLVKEKELCNRIEELERNISQNREGLHEGIDQRATMIPDEKLDTMNANRKILSHPTVGDKECICDQNGINRESPLSTSASGLENDEGSTISSSRNQRGLVEILSEMSALKETNESMESELKEMQQRYSAISLKFAEVEGERQHLVMTVRNLRSSLKN